MTATASYWTTNGGAGTPPDHPVESADGRRLETPTRLWMLLVTAVTAVLTVSLVTAFSLAGRESTATSTAQSTEALYVDAQDLAYNLADANATATTSLLVGRHAPGQFNERYDADLTEAEDLLASTSQHVAGDAYALGQLKLVGEQIPVYTGLIGQALADDRLGAAGASAADSSLDQASALLTGSLLFETNNVILEEQAATVQGTASADTFPWWVLLFGLLGFVAVRIAGRRVARISNRRLNPGLLGATIVVLGLIAWSLFAWGGAGIETNSSNYDFTGVSETQSQLSQLSATETYMALQLIDHGSDKGADEKGAKAALAGADPDLSEVTSSSATAVADAQGAFSTYSDCVLTAVNLAAGGQYQQATTTAVGSGANGGESGCEAEAETVRGDVAGIFDQSQAHFTADMSSLAGQYAGSGALPVPIALGVLGAAAAAYGVNRRLAEYR